MTFDVPTWEKQFDCKRNGGWLALQSRDERIRRHFRTSRLAKLLPEGELHFTIGATEHGRGLALNARIKELIAAAGFRSFDRRSTAGGRDKIYPALDAKSASTGTLLGLLRNVEREALGMVTAVEDRNWPRDPRRSLELPKRANPSAER